MRERIAYRRKPDDFKRGKKSDRPYKVKKPQMPTPSPTPIPGVGEDEASHKRHVTVLKAAECKKATQRNMHAEKFCSVHVYSHFAAGNFLKSLFQLITFCRLILPLRTLMR